MFIREEIHFNYSRAISASENNLESLDLAEKHQINTADGYEFEMYGVII